ncbi:MAG: hypothetical protein DYG88_14850 [Chloroflexi bacterium CFX4]|nr:hypothetical protein [Chloroflexi bacterium CFX4]
MKLTRILIIDPEIGFAVPIKQALEGIGRYRVNVFASSQAALELLAREPQDFAVIDAAIEDAHLPRLIETLQRLHPQLVIIMSRYADQPPAFAPETDVLPSLNKPYLARQLDALIRERNNSAAANTLPAAQQRTEPTYQPDDTFMRAVAGIEDGSTTLMLTETDPLALSEPSLPPDATVRDLISGTQPLPSSMPPASLPELAEAPNETLVAAEVALEVALDDSVPLLDLVDRLAGEAEKLPPNTRPEWIAPVPPPDSAPPPPRSAPSPSLEQTLSSDWRDTVQMAAQQHSTASASTHTAANPIAALALRFMQLTIDAAAKAAVLTREGEVIAVATSGSLDEATRTLALREIERMWQGESSTPTVFRPLQVNPETLYLLYSTRSVDDLILSLIFPGDTPMRVIRQVARQLHEAMARVPDLSSTEAAPIAPAAPPATLPEITEPLTTSSAPPAAAPDGVPEAAQTLHSRPTDLRPPQGLREAAPPPPPPAPPLAFTLALLPYEAPLAAEITEMLPRYLEEIAAAEAWQLEGLEIQPTHVSLQLSVPATLTPSVAAERLIRETTERTGSGALWLDACYIITPSRSLTQRELAEFLEYARLVQGH